MNSPVEEIAEAFDIQEVLNAEYDLVVYNDDVNSFDHVIESLVDVCQHQLVQAEQCTWIIHHNGKCSVKRGSYEKLEPMHQALLDRQISTKIEC